MNSSAYYVQAIKMALGLLRQGQNEHAKNTLQDALDLKLTILPSDMIKEEELELDVPQPGQVPHFWIEESDTCDICVDDDGWNIDNGFKDELVDYVETSVVLGMSTQDILLFVRVFLEAGIKQGRVRRIR